ncbi:MAG TPA: family 10 glycosylhydrolase [Sphingobacteriaceae bacterium]
MKKLVLTAFSLLATWTLHAQDAPKRELRGVWISTHVSLDWPNRTHSPAQQRTALNTILDHNKATGINSVYFQVRSQADAMYPSTLEPWSYYLTNNQGSAPSPLWDPLQFAIEETRKRGMEFHAWINPYRAVATLSNAGNPAMYDETHVSKTHPEWLLTVGTVQILNPGLPEVRDHVTNVIVDIVKRYDVDGIHFDDYFYPNGTTGDDAAYNADPRGFPATSAGRADWRRDNINMLIKRVNDSINAIKPWVKFGISPSGIYRSSTNPEIGSPTSAGALQHYSAMFADTRKWLNEGWVDYLMPQVYWYMGQRGSDYSLLVPWWNNNAFGRHIYIGMANYKVNTTGWSSRSEIPNQVRLNRNHANVYGQVHFRHAFLVANPLNHRDSLRLRFYNKPALLPAMSWKDSIAPDAPADVVLTRNSNTSVTLTWSGTGETSDEFQKVRGYVIYRSGTPDIDTENANNIHAITNGDGNTFTDNSLSDGTTYYYTVTSLDRLHNESSPSAIVSSDNIKPTIITQNITRTLGNGVVNITASDIDNGSSDNWGIASMSLSKTAFACTDIGKNTVTLIVTDKAGNIDSASAVVTITGTLPEPVIAVSRTDNTFTGLPANTIALGYGAQSLNLVASNNTSGNSATTYSWSPADGLTATGNATTTFTPSVAGEYTFTVEATNEFGCRTTASVSINVIDARCGDKVLVCHATGSTLNPSGPVCISENAVQAHLRKGGTLGDCGNEGQAASATAKSEVAENTISVLKAYPNPSTTQTTLSFTLENKERSVVLEIFDMSGQRLSKVYEGHAEANKIYSFPVDISGFHGQFFNARLTSSDKVYHFRIVKE